MSNTLADANTLAQLASLQLRVNAVVEGTMAGLHRSPHHGASVEFAEHKMYTPGDDLKRLDWKAYAKFDRYYVRRSEHETELRAYLVLDCSGSMGYGKPLSKLEYGSIFAASMAYLLARQGDRPGLVTFAEGVCRQIPPRQSRQHVMELLRALDGVEAQGSTELVRSLSRLSDIVAGRSLIVVVSDLFDDWRAGLRLLRGLRARGHQVLVIHLLHQDELTLPFSGLSWFEAMEGSRRQLVDPQVIRSAYRRAIDQFVAGVSNSCKEARIGHRSVSTREPLQLVLRGLLRTRSRARRA